MEKSFKQLEKSFKQLEKSFKQPEFLKKSTGKIENPEIPESYK
jgi:hypothetical protein